MRRELQILFAIAVVLGLLVWILVGSTPKGYRHAYNMELVPTKCPHCGKDLK